MLRPKAPSISNCSYRKACIIKQEAQCDSLSWSAFKEHRGLVFTFIKSKLKANIFKNTRNNQSALAFLIYTFSEPDEHHHHHIWKAGEDIKAHFWPQRKKSNKKFSCFPATDLTHTSWAVEMIASRGVHSELNGSRCSPRSINGVMMSAEDGLRVAVATPIKPHSVSYEDADWHKHTHKEKPFKGWIHSLECMAEMKC